MSVYRGNLPSHVDDEPSPFIQPGTRERVLGFVGVTPLYGALGAALIVGGDVFFGVLMLVLQTSGAAFGIFGYPRLQQWQRDRTARRVAQALAAMDSGEARK